MTARAFVSRPTTLTPEQEATCGEWLGAIRALGVEPVDVARADYERSPWRQLSDAIRSADGALILGFRQLEVLDGRWRPGTHEASRPEQWWATPWNGLEAGLAIMAGKPVLVAADDGVCEGIFAPEVWGSGVYGLSLGAALDPIPPQLEAWADAVHA